MGEILLLTGAGTLAVLGFGFLTGLSHAKDADHLAAVGTIVSERKSLWSSALIGGVWGLGHTISLFVAGLFVVLLNFEISERTELTEAQRQRLLAGTAREFLALDPTAFV